MIFCIITILSFPPIRDVSEVGKDCDIETSAVNQVHCKKKGYNRKSLKNGKSEIVS